MKVVLALLACVAVSHAAFTGSLQQRAQPAVAQAMFKVRLVAGRSGFASEIQSAIASQLNGILSQIDDAINHGQNVMIPQLQQHAANLAEALAAAGGNVAQTIQGHYDNISGQLSGHIQNVQNVIGNLLSSLGLGKGKSLSAITDLLQNIDISAIQAAITATWTNLQEQLNALVASINIHDILQGAFTSFAMQKGWFGDMWNSITGAISEVGSAAWEHVTGTASEYWQSALDAYATMTGHASTVFETVQDIASNFVAEATAVGSTVTHDAANQIGLLLGQYQDILGSQYQQVLDAIATVNARPEAKLF